MRCNFILFVVLMFLFSSIARSENAKAVDAVQKK